MPSYFVKFKQGKVLGMLFLLLLRFNDCLKLAVSKGFIVWQGWAVNFYSSHRHCLAGSGVAYCTGKA